MEINIKDKASTAVLIEVIKNQAYIKSLAKVLLNEEQHASFLESAEKETNVLLKLFLESNPHLTKE